MKLGCDACDHCRCHELAIGVQDEEIARPVEDDASARPVFVFAGSHDGAQGGIDRPVAASVRPGFVVARAVGQATAIRLGLVQRASRGEQMRFARRRLHYPENSDLRRLALRCSGHVVTVPLARVRYRDGSPFCASAFSSSCLTPRASAGARAQNSRSDARARS